MSCLARTLLAAIALATIAGCAADPRYKMGQQWVVEQGAERERLQAQGFPQYSGAH
jgi:hypothetical protein